MSPFFLSSDYLFYTLFLPIPPPPRIYQFLLFLIFRGELRNSFAKDDSKSIRNGAI